MKWLHEQGDEAHEEFDDYVVLHELYKPALKIYTYDKPRTNVIMGLFAEHLRETKQFGEAGVIFEYLLFENALECYIMAKKGNKQLSS